MQPKKIERTTHRIAFIPMYRIGARMVAAMFDHQGRAVVEEEVEEVEPPRRARTAAAREALVVGASMSP